MRFQRWNDPAPTIPPPVREANVTRRPVVAGRYTAATQPTFGCPEVPYEEKIVSIASLRDKRSSSVPALLAVALMSPSLAWASAQNVHLSGFATLSATYNDNHDVGVVTSFSQKRPAEQGTSANLDSVIGGQLDWRAGPHTTITLQGVARAGDDMNPQLRMGYLRQQLGNEVAVRIGRIRSPLYFDSDVTEIGYAYMMSRPALPLYGIVNSVSWIDGGDLQWRHMFGDTVMLVQGYGGNIDFNLHIHGSSGEADGKVRDVYGVAVSAIRPNITLRASHTHFGSYALSSAALDQLNTGLGQLSGGLRSIALNPLLPAASAAALKAQADQIDGYTNPFDSAATYTSIGFDAFMGPWRFLGEWVQLASDSEAVGTNQGYQLSAGYSVGEFTPYLSFARMMRKTALLDTSALSATTLDATLDAGLAQMQAGLDQLAQSSDVSTQSLSVGVRWDFRPNMDLKVQYDHLTTPDAMTPGIFTVSSRPFDNKVNLLTVAVDVVF